MKLVQGGARVKGLQQCSLEAASPINHKDISGSRRLGSDTTGVEFTRFTDFHILSTSQTQACDNYRSLLSPSSPLHLPPPASPPLLRLYHHHDHLQKITEFWMCLQRLSKPSEQTENIDMFTRNSATRNNMESYCVYGNGCRRDRK